MLSFSCIIDLIYRCFSKQAWLLAACNPWPIAYTNTSWRNTDKDSSLQSCSAVLEVQKESQIIKCWAQKWYLEKEMKTPLGNKTKVLLLYNPHARKNDWHQCQDCISVVRDLRSGLSFTCTFPWCTCSHSKSSSQQATHRVTTLNKADTSVTQPLCLYTN